eukprot:403375839
MLVKIQQNHESKIKHLQMAANQTMKDFRNTTIQYHKAVKRQKIEELEKEKLRMGIIREREKAKVKVDRVENDMAKMKRINQVLIASNDLKERIVADLKSEVIQKQILAEDYKSKYEKKMRELDFYKKMMGAYYQGIFKKKYTEYKNELLFNAQKRVEPMRNIDFNVMFEKLFPNSISTSQNMSMSMPNDKFIEQPVQIVETPMINERDEAIDFKDQIRLNQDLEDQQLEEDEEASQSDILAIQNEKFQKRPTVIRHDTNDLLSVKHMKRKFMLESLNQDAGGSKSNTMQNFKLSLGRVFDSEKKENSSYGAGEIIRQSSIISARNKSKNQNQLSNRSSRSNKMGVSSDKGNMLLMARDQFKQYLNQKRFNLDDKIASILNYFNELKYALYLLMGMRDVSQYIVSLQRLQSLEEWKLSLQLNLHKYADCSNTFVFKVKNQFKKSISDLYFEGETQYQKKFNLPFNHSGLMKRAIKQQEYVQDSFIDPGSQFYQMMKDKANCSVKNATAIPIYQNQQASNLSLPPKQSNGQAPLLPTYIILLCNKKHIENQSSLTTDEVKLAQSAVDAFQSHIDICNQREMSQYIELKQRDLFKHTTNIMKINSIDNLIDYFCTKALKELFPMYFTDYVIYLVELNNSGNEDNLTPYKLRRICNFDLGKQEGKFKDLEKYSVLDENQRSKLLFTPDGLVGEALKRKQDVILRSNQSTIKINTQLDFEVIKDYMIVTKVLQSQITDTNYGEQNQTINPSFVSVDSQVPMNNSIHTGTLKPSLFNRKYNMNSNKSEILALIQYRISEGNYKIFKDRLINKELFDNLCYVFSLRFSQLKQF